MSEQRWTICTGGIDWPQTIYVCPECDYLTPYGNHAEEHAATFCDPDSWPWEPIAVVPASEVDRLTRELEEAHRALKRVAIIAGADVSDGVPTDPPLPVWVAREVEELREECSVTSAEARTAQRQVRELCVLAGHPLVGGACGCGERRA